MKTYIYVVVVRSQWDAIPNPRADNEWHVDFAYRFKNEAEARAEEITTSTHQAKIWRTELWPV